MITASQKSSLQELLIPQLVPHLTKCCKEKTETFKREEQKLKGKLFSTQFVVLSSYAEFEKNIIKTINKPLSSSPQELKFADYMKFTKQVSEYKKKYSSELWEVKSKIYASAIDSFVTILKYLAETNLKEVVHKLHLFLFLR